MRSLHTKKFMSKGPHQMRVVTTPDPEPSSPEDQVIVAFLHALTNCHIIGDWEWRFPNVSEMYVYPISFKPWSPK